MKSKKIGTLYLLLVCYVFVSSIFTLLFWFTGEQTLILYARNLIEDGAITKFNTGLLLLISVLGIVIYHFKIRSFKKLIIAISGVILIVSSITIIEYVFHLDLWIDNLFWTDTVSENLSGRMTVLTAVCFLIFSLGMISLVSRKILITYLGQSIFFVLPLFALLNVITIILKLTLGWDKIKYIDSISLEAPFSFLLLSYLLVLQFPFEGFKGVVLSKNIGSKVLRKSVLWIVILPLFMAFLVLQYMDKNIISGEFGVILFTFTLISVSVIFQYTSAEDLNKSYRDKLNVQRDLLSKNKELSLFKYALDQIATVAIIDHNFQFKFVNDKFCELMQFSRHQIIGKSNELIRSDEHSDEFFQEIWDTISLGKTWIGEIKNKRADGSLLWTDTAIVPIQRRRKHKEFIIIKQDITAKKDHEAYLESSHYKQIEAKNRELEQYIYIASHDLQEPLRTIASFSEILYMDYEDTFNDDAKQIFSFIQDATSRMTQLIKHLLDYSRIGHSEEVKVIDFEELVRGLESDLSSLIERKQATIKTKNLPKAYAYPVAIRLLVQNLISNGIKFTKKDVPPIIEISAELKDKVWKFAVKDNGIGIAKKHQQKIFRIFQRLHLKEEYEGTGIGLAHCKKIVGLHEGDMWVESEPGDGSTFYFTISNQLS